MAASSAMGDDLAALYHRRQLMNHVPERFRLGSQLDRGGGTLFGMGSRALGHLIHAVESARDDVDALGLLEARGMHVLDQASDAR